MEFFQNLKTSIKAKKATVAIIGLGYVGLPMALRCIESGFDVLGFDVNKQKLKLLLEGNSYIHYISNQRIKQAFSKNFSVSSNFEKINRANIILICVPTPLNCYREPDLSYVKNSIDGIRPYLREGQLISLESTTYPGTTDELIVKKLKLQFFIGENLFIGYSPEREDPGNIKFQTKTIPKIVSGTTEPCLELMTSFYSEIVEKVVPVSSTHTAEMSKLLENIHRAVNIGLVNEMKIVADKMGIDIYEVIEAAATKPFGFVPYYPGPGLGGHCIPVDPFYLTWKAKEFGIDTKFIELAGEVNSLMPHFVLEKIQLALNEKEKSIKNSKVLILGLSYKKNVDDLRQSPSIMIMKSLKKMGALLSYSDPYISNFKLEEDVLQNFIFTDKNLPMFDCVILVTDHDLFDYNLILNYSSLIVDTRGRYKKEKNVIRA